MISGPAACRRSTIGRITAGHVAARHIAAGSVTAHAAEAASVDKPIHCNRGGIAACLDSIFGTVRNTRTAHQNTIIALSRSP